LSNLFTRYVSIYISSDLEWSAASLRQLYMINVHKHLIGATVPSYFSNYENKKC